MKTTVIFHSADADGLFCREIARKFLPGAEFIGWNHGDPQIAYPDEGMVYVLDLSPDCLQGLPHRAVETLVWIDHHKSAIQKWPKEINGYRIDGVSACRLTWQWFLKQERNALRMIWHLPDKIDFVQRLVEEPLAVRLAGEYDVWDEKWMTEDPRVELFQHGLKSQFIDRDTWRWLVGNQCDPGLSERVVTVLLEQGKYIQYARDNEYSEVIKQQGFTVQFEGLTFLACNSHNLDIRSQLFTAGIKPEHQALMGFSFNGRQWRVSMYGVPGRKDIDLSLIAVKLGGGGHAQACGFHTPKLPFIP